MLFENEEDALAWYQSHDRVLTKDFLATIPWHEVHKTPFASELLPVIRYMRDVETYTPVYFDQLMQSPTGHHPAIRAFMERWVTEEPLHGELLNRFMEEVGVPSAPTWKQDIMHHIPAGYTKIAKRNMRIANMIGTRFTAVHMTWGAINELQTLTGYQRLWRMAKHPVLEYILRAIGREESKHYFFYWSIARIRLARSGFSRALARFIIDTFWSPVGEGTKLRSETNAVIRALFAGADGVRYVDQFVNNMIAKLPGFETSTRITDRIAQAAL